MTTHDLKTWPDYFKAIVDGRKTCELRHNDRDFKEGDTLRLREWKPKAEEYTGREVMKRVAYVIQGGSFGLPGDLCVMSFADETAALRAEVARLTAELAAEKRDTSRIREELTIYRDTLAVRERELAVEKARSADIDEEVPEEIVDAGLRAHGVDPDALATRGSEFVKAYYRADAAEAVKAKEEAEAALRALKDMHHALRVPSDSQIDAGAETLLSYEGGRVAWEGLSAGSKTHWRTRVRAVLAAVRRSR